MRHLTIVRRFAGSFVLFIMQFTASMCLSAQSSKTVVGQLRNIGGSPVGNAHVSLVETGLSQLTDSMGMFRLQLDRLPQSLRVRKIGYQSVALQLTSRSTDTLRIILIPTARQLDNIVVNATADLLAQTSANIHALRQTPAAGEPDILRALPLLPAVSQPNDLVNRVHLAGGASDEHAITLDEHQFQAPFHAAGFLGSINVAALEKVSVRTHHLSAEKNGQLSGEIALETRRSADEGYHDVAATLFSTNATVHESVGGIEILANARISYLDKVLASLADGASDDLLFPGFRDGLLKLTRRSKSGSIEMIGFFTADEGRVSGAAAGERPIAWGEKLIGLNVDRVFGNVAVFSRLSFDRLGVDHAQYLTSSPAAQYRLDTALIKQDWTSLLVGIRREAGPWETVIGGSFKLREHTHKWTEPFVRKYLKTPVPLLSDTTTQQEIVSMFAEGTRRSTGNGWSATIGANVSSVGESALLAPRFLVTRRITDRYRLEVAADRRLQFDAIAGEPREGSVPQPVYLLDKPRLVDAVAAMITSAPDVVGRLMLSGNVTVFARKYRDKTQADTATLGRAADFSFIRTKGQTLGGSVSGTISFDRLVLNGSYTIQRATQVLDGRQQPTDWDAPQQFAGYGTAYLGKGWTLTAAGHAKSGVPITPIALRVYTPNSVDEFVARYVPGARNSARLPAYMRLDAGFRYDWRGKGAEWNFTANAVNVMHRTNVLEYNWQNYFACTVVENCQFDTHARRGLPIFPSVGLGVKW